MTSFLIQVFAQKSENKLKNFVKNSLCHNKYFYNNALDKIKIVCYSLIENKTMCFIYIQLFFLKKGD